MGKIRKNLQKRRKHTNHHDAPGGLGKRQNKKTKNAIVRRDHSKAAANSKDERLKNGNKKATVRGGVEGKSGRANVPFTKWDRVLLVGEGDFSFALSLAQHHTVEAITATCYDTEEELQRKYPSVCDTIAQLMGARSSERSTSEGDRLRVTIDSRLTTECQEAANGEEDNEWRGFSPPSSPLLRPSPYPSGPSSDSNNHSAAQNPHQHPPPSSPSRPKISIHYAINATRLWPTHRKTLRRGNAPLFSKIVFNFPHVGGLSTDVNRQVRANQQLLVGFFNAAKPLLVTPEQNGEMRSAGKGSSHERAAGEGKGKGRGSKNGGGGDVDDGAYPTDENCDTDSGNDNRYKHDNVEVDKQQSGRCGQILVTLFEGAPYELWNVRDLARHCGLRVVESFRFPWGAYPGYRHARTLGEIVGRKEGYEGRDDGRDDDREDEAMMAGGSKRNRGAWRGEERDARCFVLEVKDDQPFDTDRIGVNPSAKGANMRVLGKRGRDKEKDRRKRKDNEDSDSD